MTRLLLVNYEFPPLGGGAGNATVHLAQELARLGFEARVLTSAFRGLPAWERGNGFDIQRVPVIRRRADRSSPAEMLTFILSATVAAIALTREWLPDLTLAFFGIPGGPVAWALQLARHIPFVISLRGGDVPGFQPYDLALYHRLTTPLIRAIWCRAGAVVANSHGLQALAQRTAPEVPIGMIPNGVDADRYRPHERRSGSPARLVFVGRLARQKGLDLLLEAVARLPGREAALDIVGDGPERERLEGLAASREAGCPVRFLGWRSGDDLVACYQSADVFVVPSRDEGMPNTVLEAMACGLPVVGSRISGIEEAVRDGETGLLFPPGDVGALADTIARLMADGGERARMGAAARDRVRGAFTWASAGEAYARLIRDVLSGNERCAASADK